MTRCAHLGTTTKTTEQWLCWLVMGLWSLEIASCLRVLRALQSAFYSTMRMNKLMPSLFGPKSNYILFTGKRGHNTLVLLSLSQPHILFTGKHDTILLSSFHCPKTSSIVSWTFLYACEMCTKMWVGRARRRWGISTSCPPKENILTNSTRRYRSIIQRSNARFSYL